MTLRAVNLSDYSIIFIARVIGWKPGEPFYLDLAWTDCFERRDRRNVEKVEGSCDLLSFRTFDEFWELRN